MRHPPVPKCIIIVHRDAVKVGVINVDASLTEIRNVQVIRGVPMEVVNRCYSHPLEYRGAVSIHLDHCRCRADRGIPSGDRSILGDEEKAGGIAWCQLKILSAIEYLAGRSASARIRCRNR